MHLSRGRQERAAASRGHRHHGHDGTAILDAIIAGERDPQKLAAHRDHRRKKSVAEIAAALKGEWKEEQLFTLRQSLTAAAFQPARGGPIYGRS